MLWREFNRIASAGEGNKAAQLVKTVGATPKHLKREVKLCPGDVAERAYWGDF